MGSISVPNLVPWLIFNVSIFDVTARIITDQFCCIRLHFSNCLSSPKVSIFNLSREGIKEKRNWREGLGGDYSREVIILKISVKGGDYSREVIV